MYIPNVIYSGLKYLVYLCRQLLKVQKTDFWGYELPKTPILDLDRGRAMSRKKIGPTLPKNWTSKNQDDVEA